MIEPDFLRATRDSYDVLAAEYAPWVKTELYDKPLNRTLLDAFAERVRAAKRGSSPGAPGAPGAPDAPDVLDIGCGPGRVSEYLHQHGVSAFGVDLSPNMVAQARQAYPHLRFEVGSMTELELPEGSLGGIVAWFSIIHVPDELLPDVLARFHRALAPGGDLLLAFQVGDAPVHRSSSRGHAISLDFHHRRPEAVAALLAAAGFAVHATLVREPAAATSEKSDQAFLLAYKPLPAD